MPTGVSALPRFAAAVSSAMTGMSRRESPACVKTRIVSGTNATSDTSFVISIEEKKHSSVISSASIRCVRARRSSAPESRRISPASPRPATDAIRQNSRLSTR